MFNVLRVWFWIKIKKFNILQINVEDIQQQRLSVGTKNTWLGFGKLHGSALKKLFWSQLKQLQVPRSR